MQCKRKIATMELKPGMKLGNGVFAKNGNLLMEAGTVLNKKMISLLCINAVYSVTIVEEDEEKETFIEPNGATTNLPTAIKETKEFQEFQKVYSKTLDLYTNSLNLIIYQEKLVDVDELLRDVDEIINQGATNFELMSMLNNMKEKDDVTYVHSINVGLIANVIGKWMKLSKMELELLTVSGLLHDIGKLQIPREIMDKPGPLTSRERMEIEKHPILGYNIIKEQPIDQSIKNVVLTHHERGDGSGYPLKSTFGGIGKYSRIVAVADVFDAMTSKRCYRKAINPFDVIHMFEIDGHMQYDSEVVITFLNNILETYIHSQVALNNGEIGEILFLNKRNPSRPIVRINGACVDLAMRMDLFIVDVI